MARHAEVTEQEIINAGTALESTGKRANSGSIRVKLGNRGGFSRIKEVWGKHVTNRETDDLSSDNDADIELPAEIQDNLERNSKQAVKNLEAITVNSFKVAQQIAEKRVSSTIEEYKAKIEDFEESEQQAGIALESCDNQISDLNDEVESLLNKNEKLLSENSHLSGQMSSAVARINDLEKKERELFELKEMYGKLLGKYELVSAK
ncbi:MAG: chromosome segregation ATPase [Colwellia sp.]|jgi:chromosome segregation ATPase